LTQDRRRCDPRTRVKDKIDALKELMEIVEKHRGYQIFRLAQQMSQEEYDDLRRSDTQRRIALILDRNEEAIAEDSEVAGLLIPLIDQVSAYEEQLGVPEKARWSGPLELHRRDMKLIELECEIQERRRRERTAARETD
jgi:hypothetical protein